MKNIQESWSFKCIHVGTYGFSRHFSSWLFLSFWALRNHLPLPLKFSQWLTVVLRGTVCEIILLFFFLLIKKKFILVFSSSLLLLLYVVICSILRQNPFREYFIHTLCVHFWIFRMYSCFSACGFSNLVECVSVLKIIIYKRWQNQIKKEKENKIKPKWIESVSIFDFVKYAILKWII